MSRSLGPGTPAPATPPPATRVARSGWRDPRLWIGVLLVTASVVLGSRLLAAADDTVAVWTYADAQGPGSPVTADDLVSTRVRFADGDEEALYLRVDERPADGVVLRAGVGAGELVARSDLVPADGVALAHVPLEVAPNAVEPSVGEGSVVDVYVDDAARRSRPSGRPRPALDDVTVLAAPAGDGAFAVDGNRQLVVAVPEDEVPAFEAVLGRLDEPRLSVVTSPASGAP
ncbi:hypothetical protein [Nocardioides panacisoli]|uniref:Flagellar protein FlgA n=1 Tax=Nocardioides panacisoli TaxID=627624 RepID=A0ABP7J680_9ACTN